MKEAWYRKLNAHVTGGMKDFSVHMVCSDHFQRGDLRRNGLRVLLKNGAVPTLYLDKPKESLNSMNKPTNKPKTSVDINNHFNGQKKVYPEMPLAQEQKNKKKSNLEKDESSWYRLVLSKIKSKFQTMKLEFCFLSV